MESNFGSCLVQNGFIKKEMPVYCFSSLALMLFVGAASVGAASFYVFCLFTLAGLKRRQIENQRFAQADGRILYASHDMRFNRELAVHADRAMSRLKAHRAAREIVESTFCKMLWRKELAELCCLSSGVALSLATLIVLL